MINGKIIHGMYFLQNKQPDELGKNQEKRAKQADKTPWKFAVRGQQ